ncbi:MAG: hypothetical protein AB1801_25520, partial [Chloroflexota bacterium]
MRNPDQTPKSPKGNQRRISLAHLTAAILMGMALLSGCGPAVSNQTSAAPTVTEAVERTANKEDLAEADQI